MKLELEKIELLSETKRAPGKGRKRNHILEEVVKLRKEAESLKKEIDQQEAFTVVMPVHNEEKFLPLSLRSVYNLNPSEVILIFDRCTDRSLKIAKDFVSTHQLNKKTKIIETTEHNKWKFRVAFLRCLGMDMASNDIIIRTDADIILDPRISKHISRVKQFPLISFNYIDYPISFRNLILRFITKLTAPLKVNKFSQIYIVDRKIVYECEDREKLKQLDAGEDNFIHYSIKKRYPVDHVITNSINLRPKHTAKRHYWEGKKYWKSGHKSFQKTALVAIVSFKFNLIKGYIHERFRDQH